MTPIGVRYLENQLEEEGSPVVVERLVKTFEAPCTTDAKLKENIVDFLNKLHILIEQMVAQCYDGAGNMSGKYKVEI